MTGDESPVDCEREDGCERSSSRLRAAAFARKSPVESRTNRKREQLTTRADRSAHRSILVLIIPTTPLPPQRLFFAKPPFCLNIFRQLFPLEARICPRIGIVANDEGRFVSCESRSGGGSGGLRPAGRVDLTCASWGRADCYGVGICVFGDSRRSRSAGEGRRLERGVGRYGQTLGVARSCSCRSGQPRDGGRRARAVRGGRS